MTEAEQEEALSRIMYEAADKIYAVVGGTKLEALTSIIVTSVSAYANKCGWNAVSVLIGQIALEFAEEMKGRGQ